MTGSPEVSTKSNGTTDPLTTEHPGLYLFVDDYWIAEQEGLSRLLNRPEVLPEPIIWPDKPQVEQDCAWGNVLREPDGRIRLWYTTMRMGHEGRGGHAMAAAGVWGRGNDFSFYPRSEDDRPVVEHMLGRYAESRDGLHWVKPELGLIEFRGSRRNNIVLNGTLASQQTDGALTNADGFTVVRDDEESDPTKRYKLIAHWESIHYWDNHSVSGALGRPEEVMKKYHEARGKYITFSPDGILWNQPLVRLQVPSFGDRCLVTRNHRHQYWWLNNRPNAANGYGAAGLQTSKDLINWSPIEAILPRTEDNPDHPDIESLIPFNYGNQDLAFLITQVKRENDSKLLSFIASHHDGEDWKRVSMVPTEPFIPPGPKGSYYSNGAVVLQNEPLIIGEELLIYFNAFALRDEPQSRFGRRSIGVAKLRRDAFAGLTAGNEQAEHRSGRLVTRPLKVSSPNLYLNIEQRGAGGAAKVALRHADQRPIPGFGPQEALPITQDGVRHQVSWKNRADIGALLGQDVVIEMELTGPAILYAIVFE
ncbi:MAG: hypothetical protein GXY44_04540 [Phycisphaerales bacterium]|nr:hypothetical protein [Phycisphaerales bacterium]